MSFVIDFCNNNIGFVEALLSLLTLFISIIAIVVSLCTARLPYKKKTLIRFHSCFLITDYVSDNYFYSVGITNIGNIPVYLQFFGLGTRVSGQIQQILSRSDLSHHKGRLDVGETLEVKYTKDVFQELDMRKCFLLSIESNGKHHIRKIKKG